MSKILSKSIVTLHKQLEEESRLYKEKYQSQHLIQDSKKITAAQELSLHHVKKSTKIHPSEDTIDYKDIISKTQQWSQNHITLQLSRTRQSSPIIPLDSLYFSINNSSTIDEILSEIEKNNSSWSHKRKIQEVKQKYRKDIFSSIDSMVKGEEIILCNLEKPSKTTELFPAILGKLSSNITCVNLTLNQETIPLALLNYTKLQKLQIDLSWSKIDPSILLFNELSELEIKNSHQLSKLKTVTKDILYLELLLPKLHYIEISADEIDDDLLDILHQEYPTCFLPSQALTFNMLQKHPKNNFLIKINKYYSYLQDAINNDSKTLFQTAHNYLNGLCNQSLKLKKLLHQNKETLDFAPDDNHSDIADSDEIIKVKPYSLRDTASDYNHSDIITDSDGIIQVKPCSSNPRDTTIKSNTQSVDTSIRETKDLACHAKTAKEKIETLTYSLQPITREQKSDHITKKTTLYRYCPTKERLDLKKASYNDRHLLTKDIRPTRFDYDTTTHSVKINPYHAKIRHNFIPAASFNNPSNKRLALQNLGNSQDLASQSSTIQQKDLQKTNSTNQHILTRDIRHTGSCYKDTIFGVKINPYHAKVSRNESITTFHKIFKKLPDTTKHRAPHARDITNIESSQILQSKKVQKISSRK